MKLIQISEYPLGTEGGISRVGRKYAALFEQSGWTVEDICARDFPARGEIGGKRLVRRTLIEQYHAANPADLFILHGMATFFVMQNLALLRGRGCRLVLQPYYHPFEHNRNPWFGRLFFYSYTKRLLRGVDCLCLSAREADFFARYRANPIRVACGHDIDGEAGHPPGKYVLFVGRTDDNKGWRHVAAAFPDFEVRAVVDRPAEGGKNVIFLQGVSSHELRALYRNALCTVVPSRYESFSMAALESLACGTPVVVSSGVQLAPEIPAQCREDVVFGDVPALRAAVCRWASMSAAQYEEVSGDAVVWASRYRWEEVLKPVLALANRIKLSAQKSCP